MLVLVISKAVKDTKVGVSELSAVLMGWENECYHTQRPHYLSRQLILIALFIILWIIISIVYVQTV